MLADYDIDSSILDGNGQLVPGLVQIIEGDLQMGFELPMQKLAVLTEEELFKNGSRNQSVVKSFPMQSVLKAIQS